MVKYYITKRAGGMNRKMGWNTTVVYVPKDWDLDYDQVYNISIRMHDAPELDAYRIPKKITKIRSGGRLVLPRLWGFRPGDLVTLVIDDLPAAGVERQHIYEEGGDWDEEDEGDVSDELTESEESDGTDT